MEKEEILNPAESANGDAAAAPVPAPVKKEKAFDETLEQLILDTAFNKYDAVLLARRWAYELKDKEGETRPLQDLIAVSIRDILGKKVDHQVVRDLPVLKKKSAKSASLLDNLQKIQAEEREDGEKPAKKSKK